MKCRENALSVKTIGGLRNRRSIAGDLIYWLCGRLCNSHKPSHSPKIAKELAFPTQTKLFLKNFPTLQKNKNTPTHSPTNTSENDTETQY
jgi:hypothetical protein